MKEKILNESLRKTIENEACLNPSYDTTLSPEKRLADFLGKYFIGLNGANAPNAEHKQEIVDYVIKHILLKEIKGRGKMAERIYHVTYNPKMITIQAVTDGVDKLQQGWKLVRIVYANDYENVAVFAI